MLKGLRETFFPTQVPQVDREAVRKQVEKEIKDRPIHAKYVTRDEVEGVLFGSKIRD